MKFTGRYTAATAKALKGSPAPRLPSLPRTARSTYATAFFSAP